MKEQKATVEGRSVTIFVPETPEEAAELQRRVESGELSSTGGGKARQPGVLTPLEAVRAKLEARRRAKRKGKIRRFAAELFRAATGKGG